MQISLPKLIAELHQLGVDLSGAELAEFLDRIEVNSTGNSTGAWERRKAWDRERKRRNSTGFPPEIPPERGETIEGGPTSSSTVVLNSETPCVSAAKKIPPEKLTKRRTPLPTDWAPRPTDFDRMIKATGSLTQAEIETTRFRDYHTAHGKLMLDWNAAYRTWAGNYSTFNSKGNGHGKRSNPDTIREWLAEEQAKRERRGEGDRPDLQLIPGRR